MNTWRSYTSGTDASLGTQHRCRLLYTWGVVKGVGPKAYMAAQGLKKAGAFKESELAGVNLGEVSGMELLEPGAQGKLDQAFGVKVGGFSRPIMHKVQGIEDHFRRAAFVQSLDKQAKQSR
jgi:hypothetical protein